MSTISNTNQTIATNDYSSLLWRIELLEKEVKKLRNSSSKRSSGNSATKKNEHFRITMLKAEATANKKAVTAGEIRLVAQKKAAKQAEKKQKSEVAALKKAATAEKKRLITQKKTAKQAEKKQKAESSALKKAATAEKKRLITQKKAAKQAEKKQKAEAAALKKAATAKKKESISIIQSLFV